MALHFAFLNEMTKALSPTDLKTKSPTRTRWNGLSSNWRSYQQISSSWRRTQVGWPSKSSMSWKMMCGAFRCNVGDVMWCVCGPIGRKRERKMAQTRGNLDCLKKAYFCTFRRAEPIETIAGACNLDSCAY